MEHIHGQPVDPERYTAFFKGELDTNQIVVLMQDVIDSRVPIASPEIYDCAIHCVMQGLNHAHGRLLQ